MSEHFITALLLNRLHKKHGSTGDKRTWSIGGKDSNRDRQQAREQSMARGAANGGAMPQMDPSAALIESNGTQNGGVTAGAYADGSSALNGNDDILAGLEGLDLPSPTAALNPAGEAADTLGAAREPLIDRGTTSSPSSTALLA